MNYSELVRDFVYRTEKNLEAIEQLQREKPDAQAFEVTALVNSLLGLLIVPQQKYIDSIPETPLEQLAKAGWSMPEIPTDRQAGTLRELVRHLRNAIAHFRVEFLTHRSAIVGLKFEDVHKQKQGWTGEFRVAALRDFARRFAELMTRST